jgi:hypothetical protein
MKRLFIIYMFLVLFIVSCSKTIISTGAAAEENIMNMSSLDLCMTKKQVLSVMGSPYKTEKKYNKDGMYDIWYYITEPILLGQSKLIDRNFTPLIFEGGYLIGWGRSFYRYTFDINNEKWKRQEEANQQYTNDEKEWPRNKHAVISPMNAPNQEAIEVNNDQASKDESQDAIAKEIIEVEHPKTPEKKKGERQAISNQEDSVKKQQNKDQNLKPKRKRPFRNICKKPKPAVKKPKKPPPPAELDRTDSRCKNRPKNEDYFLWE